MRLYGVAAKEAVVEAESGSRYLYQEKRKEDKGKRKVKSKVWRMQSHVKKVWLLVWPWFGLAWLRSMYCCICSFFKCLR